MATSGQIWGGVNTGTVEVWINWWAVQYPATNTTEVSVNAYARRPANFPGTAYGYANLYIGINGQVNSFAGNLSFPPGSDVYLLAGSKTVIHNSFSGQATVHIEVTGSMSGGSMGWNTMSCGSVFALDPFDKASTPTITPSSFNMGTSPNITFFNANGVSNYTHNVYYAFGSIMPLIGATGASSIVWQTSASAMGPEIPSVFSGTGSIFLDTLYAGQVIGRKSCPFTATLVNDSNAEPTANWSPAPALYNLLNGSAIQNKTGASATIVASGKLGARVASINFHIDGKSNIRFPNSASGTETYILNSIFSSTGNAVTATGIVTDTRSKVKNTSTQTFPMIYPYSGPVVSNFSFFRCGSGKVENEIGTYVALNATGKIASVCPTQNFIFKYREKGTSPWTTVWTLRTLASRTTAASGAATGDLVIAADSTAATGVYRLRTLPASTPTNWDALAYDAKVVVSYGTVASGMVPITSSFITPNWTTYPASGGISPDKNYEVQAYVQDDYTNDYKSDTLPIAFTLLDFASGGSGIAIGKTAVGSAALFDINLSTNFGSGVIISTTPPGVIYPWAGQSSITSAPSGFLLCDGSGYATGTYINLFNVIGYAYGGAGATFNVPNLQGKIPVGYDSGTSPFNTIAASGGSKDGAVITHTHEVRTDGTWAGPDKRIWADFNAGGATAVYRAEQLTGMSAYANPFYAAAPAGSVAVTNVNLQPYVIMRYIIKY